MPTFCQILVSVHSRSLIRRTEQLKDSYQVAIASIALNLVLALLAIVTVRAGSMAITILSLLAGAIAIGFVLRRFSRPQAS